MSDSNAEFEKEIKPVNAILGESFNLFPESQPLISEVLIPRDVHFLRKIKAVIF